MNGTDQLRRANTALVVRRLREGGAATRAELAVRTGLAKATVGVIVGALERAGALVDEPGAPAGRGRPGRPVALRPGAYVGLGLELNVDYVAAVVLDLAGNVVSSESLPVGEDRVEQLHALADGVRRRHAGRLVGATVAVPALVRDDATTIAWAPNLPVRGDALAGSLADALGCPVRVLNDANCAAYAEAFTGAARGVRDFLYLTGTVGIGAGIVTDGQLLTGATGFAGEVGHIPVGDPEALCGCGRRGCWEASVGLHAVLHALGMEERGTPLQSAEEVAARAEDDPGAREVLERLGHDIGLGVATLASVLDPELVVLGGYFVPLAGLVLEPARRALDARLASAAQRRPDLRVSTLDSRAAAIGAAEQSFADFLAGTAGLPA